MKVVLDNAVLVRTNEYAHGVARELLTSITESERVLVLSNEMLRELARVLRYPRLRSFYGLTEDLIYDYIAFLRRSAEVVALNPLLAAPIGDVNDMIVLQTAIVGEASMLCTNDRDFFEEPAAQYLSRHGIRVLDDVAMMKWLRPR